VATQLAGQKNIKTRKSANISDGQTISPRSAPDREVQNQREREENREEAEKSDMGKSY